MVSHAAVPFKLEVCSATAVTLGTGGAADMQTVCLLDLLACCQLLCCLLACRLFCIRHTSMQGAGWDRRPALGVLRACIQGQHSDMWLYKSKLD